MLLSRRHLALEPFRVPIAHHNRRDEGTYREIGVARPLGFTAVSQLRYRHDGSGGSQPVEPGRSEVTLGARS